MSGPEPFAVLSSAPEETQGAEGLGWRLEVHVPLGTPLCDGHFPGRPIVPGVAHLAFVARALTDQAGTPVALAGLHGLRLRRPVQPGDTLEIRLRPAGADGAVRFEVRRGGEAVSDGRVRTTASAASPLPEGERTATDETEVQEARAAWPPIETLLPHRGAMRLVQQVLRTNPDGVLCRCLVPHTNPLVADDGSAPLYLGLEAAAQAAAIHEALHRPPGGGPRIGYLVGVREAVFFAPRLAAETPFLVEVTATGSAAPLAIYTARIGPAAAPLATATLSTYVPE
jgi:predicted hotdog family 3-hydroxylacyl-ACP dehydratase